MLKVFLVEDESIMRKGLRDNIPWQQYGYEFVGEASDGEMALPLIRKTIPDVLITDIKMPFMNGIALSQVVTREFPNIKIIIISGYDEFEFARQAIQIGVEQYLLKPITRSTMQKVLLEVREKIENEREQKSYVEKFQEERHEYEQFSRRYFFEQIFEGKLSVQQIYEEAQKLSLEMDASCYNIVLVSMQEKRINIEDRGPASEICERQQEELLRFFLRFSEYMVFRWNINTYGILIKGDTTQMKEYTERCILGIKRICEAVDQYLEWYVAEGIPVERLSMLSECYRKVNHIFSYRFLVPLRHILSQSIISEALPDNEEGNYESLELAKIDPEIIRSFLAKGSRDEIEGFVDSYFLSLQDALKSKLFRDYLILNIRFITLAYMEALGFSQAEFLKQANVDKEQEHSAGLDVIRSYVLNMMSNALQFRDRQNNNQGKYILKKALDYIERNYTQETLSLNEVASVINVSANYFSAIFSNEMKMTFVEYVTQKRMERAKKLLRQTDKHSGEIATEVGYKDSHYFSFVFKKTQGYTPREYRNGKEDF